MNQIQLVGRVGRDPEIKTFDNGDKITNFSLATRDSVWKDKQTGEWNESTTWHEIQARGERKISKGDMLSITGQSKTRSYETQDGAKRTFHYVKADSIQRLKKAEGTAAPVAQTADEDDLPF